MRYRDLVEDLNTQAECTVEGSGYKVITVKGDKLIRSSSRITTENKELFNQMWNYIKGEYILDKEASLIILPPSVYWYIYKKMAKGSTVLLAGIWKDELGNKYIFPKPNYYYEIYQVSREEKLEDSGIYGIYSLDKLLYIGSTKRDFITRWKEHCREIETSKVALYATLREIKDDIEFKPILTQQQILDDLQVPSISGFLLEAIEYAYIKIYQPLLNSQGVTQKFGFQATKVDAEEYLDLLDICIQFLKLDGGKDAIDKINNFLNN